MPVRGDAPQFAYFHSQGFDTLARAHRILECRKRVAGGRALLFGLREIGANLLGGLRQCGHARLCIGEGVRQRAAMLELAMLDEVLEPDVDAEAIRGLQSALSALPDAQSTIISGRVRAGDDARLVVRADTWSPEAGSGPNNKRLRWQ